MENELILIQELFPEHQTNTMSNVMTEIKKIMTVETNFDKFKRDLFD